MGEFPQITKHPQEAFFGRYVLRISEHGTQYGLSDEEADRLRDQLCDHRGLPEDDPASAVLADLREKLSVARTTIRGLERSQHQLQERRALRIDNRVRELEDAETAILTENDELHTKIDQLTEDTPMHIAVHQQASQEHTRLTKALLERAGLELTDLVVDDGQTLVERLLSMIVVTRGPLTCVIGPADNSVTQAQVDELAAVAKRNGVPIHVKQLNMPDAQDAPKWQDTPPKCDCWWECQLTAKLTERRVLEWTGVGYLGNSTFWAHDTMARMSERNPGDRFLPIAGGIPKAP